MKKFAMAAVAAAAMTAGVAQAYTMGTFSNGVVVPNVIHNGAADTTAVGLINRSGTIKSVYWTFFDQESAHITDGCFPMTHNDYEPFVWAAQSGLGLEGRRGYLVFALGSLAPATPAAACSAAEAALPNAVGAGNRLAANAVQVMAASSDVSYIPVIDGDLTLAAGTNLSTMGPESLENVAGAVNVVPGVGPQMLMRYFVDGTANGGNETRIVVWSTGDQRGTHTVNMFDNAQGRKSVNFALTHRELDWFDPEQIAGRPANYTDGFIEWNTGVVPADFPGAAGTALGTAPVAPVAPRSVFTYSVVSAPAFGAVQTILGAHHP
ncbi:hypothetical protein GWK50_16530 [Acidovorax sp. 210-6]|uniref:hypothetical protein n=1 Tax=Acidovorax sp. 210-6 TaxID=2699468 RepID=UPI0013894311|nr:hypothetical protein [Acidovorax sp. 210-6]NCU67430.1 hypothetical protein [Acidovorax sp. 210-6]